MKEVKLTFEEVLTFKCPYFGCCNNTGGICDVEEIDLVSYDDDENYCRDVNVPEGICIDCGGLLLKGHETVPYGDTTVKMEYLYCPECEGW